MLATPQIVDSTAPRRGAGCVGRLSLVRTDEPPETLQITRRPLDDAHGRLLADGIITHHPPKRERPATGRPRAECNGNLYDAPSGTIGNPGVEPLAMICTQWTTY